MCKLYEQVKKKNELAIGVCNWTEGRTWHVPRNYINNKTILIIISTSVWEHAILQWLLNDNARWLHTKLNTLTSIYIYENKF